MNLDKRLLRLLQDHRFLLVVSVAFGVLVALLIVLQARLLSQVVSRVFLEGASLTDIRGPITWLLILFLTRALFSSVSSISASSLALKIKTRLRVDLFERLLELGPHYTRTRRTGELTSLFVEGIDAVELYFSQYVPGIFLAAFVPLVYLVFIFPLDALTGTILLATAPLIPLFMILIGNQSQALTRRQWRSLSRMSAYFLDVIQGLKTLKALGRSKDQSRMVEQVSDRYRQTTMAVLRVTFLSALVLELVATISIAIVAVEIGLRLMYGRFEYQHALFLLLLAPEFYLPLRSLGARFHAGMAGVSAADQIFKIFEQPASINFIQAPPAQDSAGAQENLPISHIKFKHVYFEYPAERTTLRGVDLDIHAGQITALVGRTGAGKSTIADLLLRFNQPATGSITLDGESLSEIPREVWLENIAWVPQNPYLFNASISRNIHLAVPGASRQQVQQAARLANAHSFIQELSQGYDTPVGEHGAKLSAGQIQRIALARAFLKNAPILILDEPAANLDPHTESLLHNSLQRFLVNRTAVVIAHRLSTITSADQVILLENGVVAESGTHQELARSDGTYARMLHAAVDSEEPGVEIADGSDVPHPAGTIQPDSLPAAATAGISTPLGIMPPKKALEVFVRLVRLISPYTWSVMLSVMVAFATVISAVGLMGTSAYIISAAALQPSIADLQLAIVGVRFFGIARSLFRYLERYISHQTTFKLLTGFRTWFYNALEPLVPARTTSYTSGDLLGRLQGDIQSLESFYVRGLAPPIAAFLVTVFMSFTLSLLSPGLGITAMLFMMAAGIVLPGLTNLLGKNLGRRTVVLRAQLNTLLVDGIQGLPDLLVNCAERRFVSALKDASADLAAAQLSTARLDAFQSSFVLLLTNLCMWALLVLAVPMVETGSLPGVYLAAVILSVLSAFEAVIPIPQAAQYLEMFISAAQRLFEITDTQPEVSPPLEPLPVPTQYKIRVRDLSFHYPAENFDCKESCAIISRTAEYPLVLDRIDLSLNVGEHVALVGASGAGKSTIASLLMRFWEYPTESDILLDKNQLRAYSEDKLRRSYSSLLQGEYIFNASIRENLLIARPSASPEEIQEAVENAQLHNLVAALPDGYDTLVGERGTQLSAGERQRLLLARVFLSGAQFILLDEPTAHLDGLTQRAVLQSLKRYAAGRSLLLISHRLSGLDWMDEIIVLERGRVVERGAYQELLSRGGVFRRMWDLEQQTLFT